MVSFSPALLRTTSSLVLFYEVFLLFFFFFKYPHNIAFIFFLSFLLYNISQQQTWFGIEPPSSFPLSSSKSPVFLRVSLSNDSAISGALQYSFR